MNILSKIFTPLVFLAPCAVNAAVYEFAPYDLALVYSDKDKIQLAYANYSYNFEGSYPEALGGGKTGDSFNDSSMVQVGFHSSQLVDKLSVTAQLYRPYDLDVVHKKGFYKGAKASIDSRSVAMTAAYQFSPKYSFFVGANINETSADVFINKNMVQAGASKKVIAGVTAAATAPDAQGAAQAAVINGIIAAGGNPADPATAAGVPAAVEAAIKAGIETGVAVELDKLTAMEVEIRKGIAAGLIAGGSYHMPEVGLRATLSYQGEINHTLDTIETVQGTDVFSKTKIKLPQAVTLDFETGLSESVLLTFSAQWREWSEHTIKTSQAGSIGTFSEDDTTYKLGLAKQFTLDFSAFTQLTYEEGINDKVSPLAPNDGYQSITLGGAYSIEKMTFMAALEVGKTNKVSDEFGSRFDNNTLSGLTVAFERAF